MPPARIPGRLTSSRLVGSSRSVIFSQRDPHLPVVWRVCHIPPGKLPRSFDNLSMHSCEQERMAGAELSASPSQGGCEGPLAGVAPPVRGEPVLLPEAAPLERQPRL